VRVDRTGAFPLRYLFPLGPLVPELPAVLDLRQQLPNPFDVSIGPQMNCYSAGCDDSWCWYFLGSDVAAKSGVVQTQLLSRVEKIDICYTVADSSTSVRHLLEFGEGNELWNSLIRDTERVRKGQT